MDQTKLDKLRALYADREVFHDGEDPVLTAAARQVQCPDGRRAQPYSGIPTLLGLPSVSSAADLDIALVGVPMDLGVSNRPGARFGPRAVRGVERIGPYHPTFRGVPKSAVRAADVGDVPFRSRFSLEQSLEDIEQYYAALVAQGVRPLSVGIGADVVEVAPQYDPTTNTSQLAAQLLFEEFALMALGSKLHF